MLISVWNWQLCALFLMLTWRAAELGSYYFRWPQQKLQPAAGLTDLSNYILSTISSIDEPSICASKCNLFQACKTAQYQLSTKTCALFSVSSANATIAKLVKDADYITFTVNEAAVTRKEEQKQESIYYDAVIGLTNNPTCSPIEAAERLKFVSEKCTNSLKILSPTIVPPWVSFLVEISDWMKVDLQRFVWVTNIRYQLSGTSYWHNMQFDYSYDDVRYRTLVSGPIQIKQNTVAVSLLKPLLSRYWKMTEFSIAATNCRRLRLSFYYCPTLCKDALGMENLQIEDESIKSNSTLYDLAYPPYMARLNHGLGGFRSSSSGDVANIIIDLTKSLLVSGVQVQGCRTVNSWVTYFRVQYKVLAGDDWIELSDDTGTSPFKGNIDSEGVATEFFLNGTVVGRYFNLLPIAFNGLSACWKAELLGCNEIPSYAPNLIVSKKPISIASIRETALWWRKRPNRPITRTELYSMKNFVKGTTVHVPTNGTSRAMLTFDLKSEQTIITSVEISTESAKPEVSLIPDGLWLFDILHGGDDISGNGNHALLGEGVTYGDGPDGRPNGAITFTSTISNVLIPVTNVGMIPGREEQSWTVAMWVYVDPPSKGVPLFSFFIESFSWRFSWLVHSDGIVHNNYFASDSALNWPFEEKSSSLMPFGRWAFVGFSLDCRSGMASRLIDKKTKSKRWYGCPSDDAMPANRRMTIWWAEWIGRVSCLQFYFRALHRSELEQASLCPWLPPAPFAMFPFDCNLNDIQRTGLTFGKQAGVTCGDYNGLANKAWNVAYKNGHLIINKPGVPSFGLVYSFTILLHVHLVDNNFGNIYSASNSSITLSKATLNGGPQRDANYVMVRCPNGHVIQPKEKADVLKLQTNKWTYLGFTFDHTKKELGFWQDGELVLKQASPECSDGPTLATSSFGVAEFTGSTACLQFYKTVLAKRQINSVRRCPWSGNNSSISNYYPHDSHRKLPNVPFNNYCF